MSFQGPDGAANAVRPAELSLRLLGVPLRRADGRDAAARGGGQRLSLRGGVPGMRGRYVLECYAHQKRCNIFESVRMRKYFN